MKNENQNKISIDNWAIHDALNSLFGHMNISKATYAEMYNYLYKKAKKQ